MLILFHNLDASSIRMTWCMIIWTHQRIEVKILMIQLCQKVLWCWYWRAGRDGRIGTNVQTKLDDEEITVGDDWWWKWRMVSWCEGHWICSVTLHPEGYWEADQKEITRITYVHPQAVGRTRWEAQRERITTSHPVGWEEYHKHNWRLNYLRTIQNWHFMLYPFVSTTARAWCGFRVKTINRKLLT